MVVKILFFNMKKKKFKIQKMAAPWNVDAFVISRTISYNVKFRVKPVNLFIFVLLKKITYF